jgi:tRNA threonylcarbamoyladenosine biosynthesis protein TsaB
MKLLALDTSSLACTVAVQRDDVVKERHEEQPREHTRLLLPMISSLLEECDLVLTDLDAIVLGNGPGSFIGMRIAASVAQGLAYGAGLQIIPVSSLAAVAAAAFAEDDADEVIVAQDAHMNEIYLGVYGRDAAALPVATSPERLHAVDVIKELDPATAERRVAAGYGWERYPGLAEANRDRISRMSNAVFPHARILLRLGQAGLSAGRSIDPANVAPAYLRQKVAEAPRADS